MVQRVERGVKRGQGGEGKREEGEILYIYIYILPLANSNRAGGAKRVKSSGARNR